MTTFRAVSSMLFSAACIGLCSRSVSAEDYCYEEQITGTGGTPEAAYDTCATQSCDLICDSFNTDPGCEEWQYGVGNPDCEGAQFSNGYWRSVGWCSCYSG